MAQPPSLARTPIAAPARVRSGVSEPVVGVDYGPLAEWLGFHLRMAQIASFHAFASEVGEVDLPPGRFALLTLIGRNPGISQTVLSRAAGRDKSTLTPALRDLKKRGMTFVGSTIIYAFMQAVGLVNDHMVGCFRYREVQR